jgi:glutathione S-transferase
MRLLYSALSPFARKVRIVAHENGLTGEITLETHSPYAEETVRPFNPLSKVPTLVLDDGEVIYDSSVICDYLDSLGGAGLIPATGPERRKALTLQALADGMGDAALAVVRERMRPEAEHRADIFERQTKALNAALDAFEAENFSPHSFGIGEIAAAAQLAYLDARKVIAWREGRPGLAAWFEAVSRRESMSVTSVQLT